MPPTAGPTSSDEQPPKIILYGEEVVNKRVSASKRQGRVYLPLTWLGKKVKIIRLD